MSFYNIEMKHDIFLATTLGVHAKKKMKWAVAQKPPPSYSTCNAMLKKIAFSPQ